MKQYKMMCTRRGDSNREESMRFSVAECFVKMFFWGETQVSQGHYIKNMLSN